MKRFWIIAGVVIVLGLVAYGCGGNDKKDPECPQFQDSQLYPASGGPDTEFELFVLLKGSSENKGVEGIRADLFTSDGSGTGIAYDLVRSDVDAKRFLRAFKGSDVCEEGVCNLYFQVIATHSSGCIKGFDTPIFQVAYEGGSADDDSDDDSDDDTFDDDDTTDDDTADDDTADDDTADDDTA